MTVDLRAVPTQVIVNGLDVSQAFISLSISGNALDDSGWFRPRGQIVLGQLPGFSESFDCRANPGRWAPGNIVAVSVWLGGVYVPLPWRLRILAYPNRPMPGSRTITLEVGTDADLLNYRAPEGDPGNDEYGTPAGATTLINRALAQAGAPALTDTISTFSLPFSPEKNTGGSWIAYAGSVAYAARQVLWQQTNGDIRATPLTLDGLTPAATYTVGTDEADYVLSAPGEQPPESVEVQGTTYLIEDATPEGTDVTEEINGVLTRTRVEFEDWETDDQKIIETVWIPLELIAPPKFAGNSNPSVLKITTTTRSYDIWGRLTQTEIEVQQPLFVRPTSTSQALWPFSRTTITNEYPLSFPEPEIATLIKTRELITKRTTREQVLPATGLNLVDRLVTVESWERKKAEQYLYQRNVTDSSEDSLRVQSQPSPPQFEAPPATEFKPATKQRTEVSRRGQARFTNAVGSSFADKKWVISLPSGMGVSDDQCRAIASLWGKIRQGRQFKVRWSADLTANWLTNFSPVARVNFTLDGLTTAYLVEGFSIELDQRSAAIGGLGLEIGQVSGSAIIPPYRLIPEAYHAASIGGLIMAAVIESTVDATHAVNVGGLSFAAEIGALPTDVSFAAAVGGLSMAANVDPVIAVDAAMAVGGLNFAANVNDNNVALHAANVGGLSMSASGGPVVAVTHAANVGGLVMSASVEAVAADPILTTANLHTYYNANFGVFQSNGGAASGNGEPVGFWDARGATAIDAEQTTAEAKPTITTLNSKPSLSFDGGDSFTAGSIGNWNFLHNSTGFTAVIVFKKTTANPGTSQALIDTCGISSANIGLSIFYDDRAIVPADDRLRVFIGRGVSGGPLQDRQSANGVLDGTDAHLIVVRFNGVSTLNARVDGVQVINNTTNNFGTPSASNSTFTLNLGRTGSDIFYASGQVPLVALFNDDLSLSDVEAIEDYWMAEYGIT